MADRGEQRGAHPVGLGERPGGGGLLGEALLAQRDRGLGGERLDDAPVGGGQRPAAQHQGELVVDRHVGVALAGAARHGWSPTLATTRQARSVARRGPGRPAASGGRSSSVTARRPNVSRSRSSSAGSGRSPRSTLPATVARVCGSALARAASRVRRAARSTTAADRDGDDDEDDQGEQVLAPRRWSTVWIGGVKK